MNRVGRDVLLVHAGCADGLTSAGLLLRRFPGAEVRAVYPAEVRAALEALAAEPDVGRLVLADLSPQAADLGAILTLLERLRGRAEVAWIDHHAPQWTTEFERAVRGLRVDVLLDRSEKESGASLSAAWTKEVDPRLLRVADLIRKRDAWVEPHNPEARAWTLVATENPEYVVRIAAADLGGLEEDGKRLLREQEARIAQALASVRRFSPRVAYLWGEDDVSDVADRLFASDPDVRLLMRFGPSRRVSLRSRKEAPIAAALAQAFGGGGHANAAGFTMRMSFVRHIVYRLARTRSGAVKAALAAGEQAASGAGPPTPASRSRS